jgi:hypothetical protein
MQRSPIPSATNFLQTIWRLLSRGQMHSYQEKALRVGGSGHKKTKLAELKTVIAPMVGVGLIAMNLAGFLPMRCLINAMVYATVGVVAIGVLVQLVTALSRRLGNWMRLQWRHAWRLDNLVVASFEEPITRELSALASGVALDRAARADRESGAFVRMLRERAGLIALTLSPRFSPIPTQDRGA